MDRVSVYEAAALYAYDRGIPCRFPCLVLDLDTCGAGVCSCLDTGEIHLEETVEAEAPRNLWEECMSAVFPGDSLPDGIETQLLKANRRMKNYYLSGCRMDCMMFRVNGQDVWCSGFEKAASLSTGVFQELLRRADALLTEENRELAGIIMTGRAASIYLFEFLARESFSADPFLADRRFMNQSFPDPPEKIVELGRECYKTYARHVIGLEVTDGGTGEIKRIPLVKKEWGMGEWRELPPTQPVFFAAGDCPRVFFDGTGIPCSLPESFAAESGYLAEVSARKENDGLVLSFHRIYPGEGMYSVELEGGRW